MMFLGEIVDSLVALTIFANKLHYSSIVTLIYFMREPNENKDFVFLWYIYLYKNTVEPLYSGYPIAWTPRYSGQIF